jgi:hypothetical protein
LTHHRIFELKALLEAAAALLWLTLAMVLQLIRLMYKLK